MRNIVLGIIVALWGAAIIIADLAGGMPNRGGAYGTGQTAAFIFAFVMIIIGICALRKGLQDRRG